MFAFLPGLKVRIFQCFSLTRNFPKLMNTDVSEKSIGCLHGVRVLTILWIILGHEYFLHAVSLTASKVYIFLICNNLYIS